MPAAQAVVADRQLKLPCKPKTDDEPGKEAALGNTTGAMLPPPLTPKQVSGGNNWKPSGTGCYPTSFIKLCQPMFNLVGAVVNAKSCQSLTLCLQGPYGHPWRPPPFFHFGQGPSSHTAPCPPGYPAPYPLGYPAPYPPYYGTFPPGTCPPYPAFSPPFSAFSSTDAAGERKPGN